MDKVSDPLSEYKISFFLSRASCPADFNRRFKFVRKRLKPDGDLPAADENNTYPETVQYVRNLKRQFEKVLLLEEAAKRRQWYSRSAPALSRREIAVAILLSEGFRVKQIAELLIINQSTAERHVANIYSKMNIHSRDEFAQLRKSGSQDGP